MRFELCLCPTNCTSGSWKKIQGNMSTARKMYNMRFSDDVSELRLEELRGIEGNRMRSVYKEMSAKYKVPFSARKYNVDDFEGGDTINKALSSANQCLYGIANAAVSALGLSAGLGFVHCGHSQSFVYDIADLYKAELSVPLAFACSAERTLNIERDVRKAMRDMFYKTKLIKRIVSDIYELLKIENDEQVPQIDILTLWDARSGVVQGGRNYGIS